MRECLLFSIANIVSLDELEFRAKNPEIFFLWIQKGKFTIVIFSPVQKAVIFIIANLRSSSFFLGCIVVNELHDFEAQLYLFFGLLKSDMEVALSSHLFRHFRPKIILTKV